MTEFNLTKEFLLKEFSDVDIDSKGLYTKDNLTISNLKIKQTIVEGETTTELEIPVEISDDHYLIKSTNAISLESSPFEISYLIQEPEGYSHYVNLNLNPTEVIDLGDLRDLFLLGSFSNEYNGSDRDDHVQGSNIAEIIRANAGLNIIYGGGGDDNIQGGNDSDYLSGEAGSDNIQGGDGEDLIDGDSLLADSFSQSSGEEIENQDPNNANDVIDAGNGDDILLGGIGNDRLIAGFGNDVIDGGEGTDTGVAISNEENYRVRKRIDGSIVVIDKRQNDSEGIDLYQNTELLEFSDQTLNLTELIADGGNAIVSEDGTQVAIRNSRQNFDLKTTQGSQIVSIDLPSLENLIIDTVILDKSLETLQQYRNSEGEKLNSKSSVIEFLLQNNNEAKEVVEIKLEREQNVNTFVKVNPRTGETFEFNYNPATGLGAELLDTNGNGSIDTVKIHLQDGGTGDADGEIDGVIYDPGILAFTDNPTTFTQSLLDVDGSGGQPSFARDGLLTSAFLFYYKPDRPDYSVLDKFILDSKATRKTGNDIASYLKDKIGSLDVDGSGQTSFARDGLLTSAFLFYYKPDRTDYSVLDKFILDLSAIRQTGNDVADYLKSLISTTTTTASIYGNHNEKIEPSEIIGTIDSDILTGDNDNNLIVGDRGDDLLAGGLGRDTFTFSINSGQDSIVDFSVVDDLIQLDSSLAFGSIDDVFSAITLQDSVDNKWSSQLNLGSENTVTILSDRELTAENFLII